MKVYILTFFIALLGMTAMNAQLKTPAPSPFGKIEQVVGLTDVTIEYSRPSMKGRTIFGDLVSMDKMWRTGANKNTMFTFSTDVTVAGQELKAGTYALFTKPGKDSWKMYFYTDTENWGTPGEWDDTKVAASFDVKPTKLPLSMETLMFNVGSINNNGAAIQMMWENTLVSFDLGVPSKKMVESSIKSLIAGPSNRDYYNMAGFYLDEKTNLDEALSHIEKSISMDYEKFWSVRRKALILAELGRYKEAIKTAEKSIELAKAADNQDYVNNNMKSIAAWKMK